METVGLLVRLEAKPGKEADVESFLKSGLAVVQEEPDTVSWFAIRMGHRHSASSTRFRANPAARRISPAESQQR